MTKEKEKPPTGAVSEVFYKEQRLRELAAAIHRYVRKGFFGGRHSNTVQIWCDELKRRLREFE